MKVLLIILSVLYAIGLVFTLLLVHTAIKTGATKEDSKLMVFFVSIYVWITSPVLMIASLIHVFKNPEHQD